MRVREDQHSDDVFLELDRAPLDIEDALALSEIDEDYGPPWWVGLALPAIAIVGVMGFGLVWYAVELAFGS